MDSIPNALTFWDFLSKNRGNINGYNEAGQYVISYLVAQVVRLFLICKAIHFDLHQQNSLVKNGKAGEDEEEVIIIDFGRASDLTSSQTDDYLDVIKNKQKENK